MNDTAATRQRFLLVFLLFLHTVNTYLDRVCISAAKSSMQDDISGLNDQMMGYAFGIFAVGYALFQVPSGWFSDRVGPRRALTIVVIVWSIFTALTGAVATAIGLLIVRFLFGVGEAGAYPGATRALYSWLPARERGLGQGIFHSGARIGAAVALVVMPIIIGLIGWRLTFVLNAVIGVAWAAVWWFWYRDTPREHKLANAQEVELIETGIQEEACPNSNVPYIQVVTSTNVLLAMFQYAASNMTFFISITWLRPYIEDRWGSQTANLAAVPLLVGAVALWVSGFLVTAMHRRGMPVLSRRIPAIVGYTMGAVGLLLCTFTAQSSSVWPLIVCFSIAMFGVEMTLSPSWAFCMDIGGSRSGAVSGAMNMVGNLGAAFSAVAFPYFVSQVTIPFFAESTGTAASFFVFGAAMNLMAANGVVVHESVKKVGDHFSGCSATATALLLGVDRVRDQCVGLHQVRIVLGIDIMEQLRGVTVGAGYFSHFHHDAWGRIDDVQIVANCELDSQKRAEVCSEYGIERGYADFVQMLDRERPDFVDIITRPESHLALTLAAVERGVAVICQKPLAPSYSEACKLVEAAEAANVPLMVHDNFRFQPWYRQIKKFSRERRAWRPYSSDFDSVADGRWMAI